MEAEWDFKSRPAYLQDKVTVSHIPTTEIMQMHANHMKGLKIKNATKDKIGFSQDGVIPRTKYDKLTYDNGVDELHPARWHRAPTADPKDWYVCVPQEHTPVVITAMPLGVSGSKDQVPPRTLELLHD